MEYLLNRFILNERYRQSWSLSALRRQLANEQYVELPQLFSPEVLSLLTQEVDRLESQAVQKHYLSEHEKTPRVMKRLDGLQLSTASRVFPVLYAHHELNALVTGILGGPVFPTPIPEATMNVHYLTEKGDTHGWHWDGAIFSVLVVMIHAPGEGEGGVLQYIPNWKFHARRFRYQEGEPLEGFITKCAQENLILERSLGVGDAYLILGDEAIHRVTPLTQKTKRAVFVFPYLASPDVNVPEHVMQLHRRL